MIAAGELKVPPRVDYLYVEQEVMADETPAVDAGKGSTLHIHTHTAKIITYDLLTYFPPLPPLSCFVSSHRSAEGRQGAMGVGARGETAVG